VLSWTIHFADISLNIEYGSSGNGNKIDAGVEHAQTNQVEDRAITEKIRDKELL
jgi:hypothetical protein